MDTLTFNLTPLIDKVIKKAFSQYEYLLFNKSAAILIGNYIDIFKMAPKERCIRYLEYRLGASYELIKLVVDTSYDFIDLIHNRLGTTPNDFIEFELDIINYNEINIIVTNHGDVLKDIKLGTRWFERYVRSLTLDDITDQREY